MRMKMNGKNKVPIFINYEKKNNCKLEETKKKEMRKIFCLNFYRIMNS